MRLHKEGHRTIMVVLLALLVINGITIALRNDVAILYPVIGGSLLLMLFILQFFRIPERSLPELNEKDILAPADGKIVAFEEVEETEYFNDRRIKLSIFMSPLDPHMNWYPIKGMIRFFRYHPGRFLVAWHPKSSSENECTTLVLDQGGERQLLVRQIAGAVARRIVCYAEEGNEVEQGKEMGFIKFGSRVDIFFPPGTTVHTELDQKVTGARTVLAKFAS